MSPQNGMTSIAMQHRDPPRPATNRPPVVAWTLRLLLCMTDTRTEEGELTRELLRLRDELTIEEAAVVVETVKACTAEIRKGVDLIGELTPDQRSA